MAGLIASRGWRSAMIVLVSDQPNSNEDFVDKTVADRTTGRNPDGSFAQGHTLGCGGRPKTKVFREEVMRQLAERPEDLQEIVKELISAAKGEQTNRFSETVNQTAAAQILKGWVDGKDKQEVEVTGEDGGPVGFIIVPESQEGA